MSWEHPRGRDFIYSCLREAFKKVEGWDEGKDIATKIFHGQHDKLPFRTNKSPHIIKVCMSSVSRYINRQVKFLRRNFMIWSLKPSGLAFDFN